MTWLLETLVWTGVLITAILLVRRPVAQHFGPRIAYALWSLPLLRLFMPPLVLPAPAATSTPMVIHDAEVMAALAEAEVSPVSVAELAAPWWAGLEPALIAIWLAGAGVYILLRLVAYRQLRSDLLANARWVGQEGRIRLVETPGTRSPLAFGIVDKVIALPIGFMALPDRSARDLALAHEFAHHKSRDLLVNFAALPLFALHWFNPLSWLGWHAMRRDQEAACDARVVEGRDRAVRAHYAAVIAGAATAPRAALAAPMACPVLGDKSIIQRLRNLTMTDHSVRRRRMGGAFVGIAALALPLTASFTYAQPSEPEIPEAPPPPPPAAEVPLPPAAPEAPEAPEVSTRIHRIVVPEGPDGETKVKRKVVIVRDGKTEEFEVGHDAKGETTRRFVFRGADGETLDPNDPKFKESMAKLEERLGKLDHELSIKLKFDEKKLKAMSEEHRKNAQKFASSAAAMARMAPRVEMTCEGVGENGMIETSDGQRVFRFCKRETMRAAVGGLRAARAAIAGNSDMSAETRREVLEKLDKEIERIEGNKNG